jgi:glycopeptide antibiotics resistance protein
LNGHAAATAAVAISAVALLGPVIYLIGRYDRYGRVTLGEATVAGVLAAYFLLLAFTVILPLRPATPGFCHAYEVTARFDPLHVLHRIRIETPAWSGRGLLESGTFVQVVLNVVLFVPMGVILRTAFGRSTVAAVAIAAAVSVFIELTQLTGNWFIYPCAYRFFDTADVLANTAGALIGALTVAIVRGGVRWAQ